MIKLYVAGQPIPQGDLAKSRYGKLYHKNADVLKPWRELIGLKAKEKGVKMLDGPVCVRAEFYFPHPKSHYRGSNPDNPLLPRWQGVDFHTLKPDADKLMRSVLDALTGIAFKDDSQVACLGPSNKYWINTGRNPDVCRAGGGAVITIETLED